MRPIGIDLFAGAGGLSLGFEQAGFDIVAAVEIDPVHAAIHEYNFPHCAVLPRSVSSLTGAAIRRAAGIGNRKVEVLFGGPPCQGFSMIGQRQLDDPRNDLVRDFIRLAGELDADYFVFENVKGLTVGDHRKFLDEFIALCAEKGYEVRLPWRVLDAADFGVPQHRERLILFGAKAGLRLPDYPVATCYPADRSAVLGLPMGPTCRDALGDIPDAERYDALRITDEVFVDAWGMPSAYAKSMRCLDNDGWHFGHPRSWLPPLLTSSARTEHTDISRLRFGETTPGTVEPISRFYKLSPIGLSNTLRAGTDSVRGAFTSPRPIHYEHDRCVTVREMARLHGFPDWFRMQETKWHGARQIGNAVPPPLARAIAGQVMAAADIQPRRGGKLVHLGDDALLRMDVTAASEHFGIVKPATRRDRKSGAVKRKQSETEAWRLSNVIVGELELA